MTNFQNRQTLPQCFIDKIEIDKVIDSIRHKIKKNQVVPFDCLKNPKEIQTYIRNQCIYKISNDRTSPIGPGSPAVMAA